MTRKITRMYLARIRAGLTQKQVAEEIGVTQPRVSAWETLSADIPPLRRAQIAKMLDVDPDLLTEELK